MKISKLELKKIIQEEIQRHKQIQHLQQKKQNLQKQLNEIYEGEDLDEDFKDMVQKTKDFAQKTFGSCDNELKLQKWVDNLKNQKIFNHEKAKRWVDSAINNGMEEQKAWKIMAKLACQQGGIPHFFMYDPKTEELKTATKYVTAGAESPSLGQ